MCGGIRPNSDVNIFPAMAEAAKFRSLLLYHMH